MNIACLILIMAPMHNMHFIIAPIQDFEHKEIIMNIFCMRANQLNNKYLHALNKKLILKLMVAGLKTLKQFKDWFAELALTFMTYEMRALPYNRFNVFPPKSNQYRLQVTGVNRDRSFDDNTQQNKRQRKDDWDPNYKKNHRNSRRDYRGRGRGDKDRGRGRGGGRGRGRGDKGGRDRYRGGNKYRGRDRRGGGRGRGRGGGRGNEPRGTGQKCPRCGNLGHHERICYAAYSVVYGKNLGFNKLLTDKSLIQRNKDAMKRNKANSDRFRQRQYPKTTTTPQQQQQNTNGQQNNNQQQFSHYGQTNKQAMVINTSPNSNHIAQNSNNIQLSAGQQKEIQRSQTHIQKVLNAAMSNNNNTNGNHNNNPGILTNGNGNNNNNSNANTNPNDRQVTFINQRIPDNFVFKHPTNTRSRNRG